MQYRHVNKEDLTKGFWELSGVTGKVDEYSKPWNAYARMAHSTMFTHPEYYVYVAFDESKNKVIGVATIFFEIKLRGVVAHIVDIAVKDEYGDIVYQELHDKCLAYAKSRDVHVIKYDNEDADELCKG